MKISAPSFVIPDTRANNVLFLKDFTNEVELLFFDSRHDYDMPETDEIATLKKIGCTYSAHLPTDTDLNTEVGWKIIDSYINVLKPLNPVRMIVHPVQSSFFISQMKKRSEHKLIIENTDFYGSFFDDAVSAGLRLCFDNAHAGEYGEDFLRRYSSFTDEYHLQGIYQGRHHKSLEHIETGLLKSILGHAEINDSTICIEVFDKNDFLTSYKIVKELL